MIYALLFGLGLICSTGQHRNWLHIAGFTVMTVIICTFP